MLLKRNSCSWDTVYKVLKLSRQIEHILPCNNIEEFPDERLMTNQQRNNVFCIHNSNLLNFVFRSRTVITLLLVASIGSIPHIWGSTLLTVTLSRLKFLQEFVGIVTTLSLITSTVFTFSVGRLADTYFQNNLKSLTMMLMPMHALTMIGLCLCIQIGSTSSYNQCKYTGWLLFGGPVITKTKEPFFW